MKAITKLATIIISIMLVFGAFSCACLAAGTGAIAAENVKAAAGDEFTVAINMNKNPGVYAVYFSVMFDSSQMDYVRTDFSGTVFEKGSQMITEDLVSSGELVINIDNGDNLTSNSTATGTLAKVTFKLHGDAVNGKHDIKIVPQDGSVIDVDANDVAFEYTAGILTVSGGIAPENTSAKASDAQNNNTTMNDETTVTDATANNAVEIGGTAASQAAGEKANNNTTLIILIIALAVIVAAALLFIFLKKKPESKTNETPKE